MTRSEGPFNLKATLRANLGLQSSCNKVPEKRLQSGTTWESKVVTELRSASFGKTRVVAKRLPNGDRFRRAQKRDLKKRGQSMKCKTSDPHCCGDDICCMKFATSFPPCRVTTFLEAVCGDLFYNHLATT